MWYYYVRRINLNGVGNNLTCLKENENVALTTHRSLKQRFVQPGLVPWDDPLSLVQHWSTELIPWSNVWLWNREGKTLTWKLTVEPQKPLCVTEKPDTWIEALLSTMEYNGKGQRLKANRGSKDIQKQKKV